MPDRNYYHSSGGRQGREQQSRWDESENDEGRFGRENQDRGYSGDYGSDYASYEGEQRSREYQQRGRGGYGGQAGYGSSSYSRPQYGRESGSSGTSNYGRSDYAGQSSGGQWYGNQGYGRGSQDFGSRQRYGNQGYFGTEGASNYGTGRYEEDESRNWRGYGGSSGSGSGFGSAREWYEPYGEGQQYGGGRQYGGGQHRGKGPKGYQRSDDRIKEMICERLREDPEIDPSDVTVNVSMGKATLDGSVDSRRTKNAIEDVVEQLVTDVQNNLRVSREGAGTGMQSDWTNRESSTETSKQKKN
jgi:BON domain